MNEIHDDLTPDQLRRAMNRVQAQPEEEPQMPQVEEPQPQRARPEMPTRDIKRLRAKGELMRAWLTQLTEQRGDNPFIGPRDVQAFELMERVMFSMNSENHDFSDGEGVGSFFGVAK